MFIVLASILIPPQFILKSVLVWTLYHMTTLAVSGGRSNYFNSVRHTGLCHRQHLGSHPDDVRHELCVYLEERELQEEGTSAETGAHGVSEEQC